MKKGFIYSSVFLIPLFFFIVKYEPFSNNPPTPIIKAGITNIASTEGSYCWNGFLYAQCVDKIYTSALDMADNYNPKVVAANEKITIKFRKKPSEAIEVFFISKGSSEKVPLINNKFDAPSESGIYYYSVTTRWKQGGGNYGFSIEVK
jgi:hypothetical protein